MRRSSASSTGTNVVNLIVTNLVAQKYVETRPTGRTVNGHPTWPLPMAKVIRRYVERQHARDWQVTVFAPCVAEGADSFAPTPYRDRIYR